MPIKDDAPVHLEHAAHAAGSSTLKIPFTEDVPDIPEECDLETPKEYDSVMQNDSKKVGYWTECWHVFLQLWPLYLGNMLEWYEYACYGYAAPYFEYNFFGGSSTSVWASYAIQYVARPFGGLFFGWLSDRVGRKKTVIISILGMLVATVSQGCLPVPGPNDHTFRYVCMTLLIAARLLQGLCAGGEVASVVVYLCESTPKRSIGTSLAMIPFGGNWAFFLSGGFIALLTSTISDEGMRSYGWRLPFLTALLPGMISLKMRSGLSETHAFMQTEDQNRSLSSCQHFKKTIRGLGSYLPQLLLSALSMCGISALWYVGPIYTASYLQLHYAVPASIAIWAANLAQASSSVLNPIVGWMIDTFGVGKLSVIGNLLVALSGLPIYWTYVYYSTSPTTVLLTMSLGFGLAQGVAGTVAQLHVADHFPTQIRATALGLVYNVVICYVGGFGPLFAAHSVENKGYMDGPGWYISIMGLISFLASATGYFLNAKGIVKCSFIRDHPY